MKDIERRYTGEILVEQHDGDDGKSHHRGPMVGYSLEIVCCRIIGCKQHIFKIFDSLQDITSGVEFVRQNTPNRTG